MNKKDYHREYMRGWRALNKEKVRSLWDRWETRNRGKVLKSKREYMRKLRAEIRREVLNHYGSVCAHCGTSRNLTIDHIEWMSKDDPQYLHGSDLWAFLFKNGMPAGFQVLCRLCNRAKGRC